MDPEEVGYKDTWAVRSPGLTEHGTASCKRGLKGRHDIKEKTTLVSKRLMLTGQGKLGRTVRHAAEPSIPRCQEYG